VREDARSDASKRSELRKMSGRDAGRSSDCRAGRVVRLGCAPLDGDTPILEATSSGAASSRAHAGVEDIADVQPLSRALGEEPLLASAAGWAERASNGCIATGQRALLHTQLLHAALQHERVTTLQLDADADERIEEERLRSQLAACTGQLVEELARGGAYPSVALHGERHQRHAAVLAQRLVLAALPLLGGRSARAGSGYGRVGQEERLCSQSAECGATLLTLTIENNPTYSQDQNLSAVALEEETSADHACSNSSVRICPNQTWIRTRPFLPRLGSQTAEPCAE
jgi:hypothetical protein